MRRRNSPTSNSVIRHRCGRPTSIHPMPEAISAIWIRGITSKSNKIGYIAAKPIPLVLRNVNSFMLGARKVNPNATVQLIVTGDWALPVREAEAANALVDAGCDIVACHIDSPKVVIETAEKRGVKSCG